MLRHFKNVLELKIWCVLHKEHFIIKNLQTEIKENY